MGKNSYILKVLYEKQQKKKAKEIKRISKILNNEYFSNKKGKEIENARQFKG